jgi:hypothetical protein
MTKLRLRLDELAVESFPTTADAGPPRGTVRGAEDGPSLVHTACGTCAGETCEGATCFTSCGGAAPPECTCPAPGTNDDRCV